MTTQTTVAICNMVPHDFREPLEKFFTYLVNPALKGHDLTIGQEIAVFNFGFGNPEFQDFDVAPSGMSKQKKLAIFKDLKTVTKDFKDAKTAKIFHKNATTDARMGRIDIFHGTNLYEAAYEIAKTIAERTPTHRSVFVVHEHNRKGEQRWHLHWIQEAREKSSMTELPIEIRKTSANYVREVVTAYYKSHDVKVRESYGKTFKASKAYYDAIPRIALHDAIRNGEADVRAGQKQRLQSPGWLDMVAQNKLPGENVLSASIREGASIKADHARHNLCQRIIDRDAAEREKRVEVKKQRAEMKEQARLADPKNVVVTPKRKGLYWPNVKHTNEKLAEIDDPNNVVVTLMSSGMYRPRTVVANTSVVKTANVVTQQQVVKTANVVTLQVRVKQHGRREQMLDEMAARRAQRQNVSNSASEIVPKIPPVSRPVGCQPLTQEQLQQVSPTTLSSSIVPKTSV